MKNIVFLAILSLVFLASCGEQKSPEQTIVTPSETTIVEEDEAMMKKDTMMDDKHEGEWTEEEMKEMEMMDAEHTDAVKDMDAKDDMMKKDTMMDDEHEGEWTEEEMKEMEMMDAEHETDTMEKTEEVMMKKAGTYTTYDASLLGKTENTVVFFHANWCPSCRAADKSISAVEIPAGLTLLKADYDTQLDLRKKYKVTSQHTFVKVDAQGNLIKKWVGGNSIEDITSKL